VQFLLPKGAIAQLYRDAACTQKLSAPAPAVAWEQSVQLVLPAKISPPLFVKLGALTLPINAPVNLPHMKEARLDYMSRGAYKL
jgi:hypothetical protein